MTETAFHLTRRAQVAHLRAVYPRHWPVRDNRDLLPGVAGRTRQARVRAGEVLRVVGVDEKNMHPVGLGVVTTQTAETVAKQAVFLILGHAGSRQQRAQHS